MMFYNADFDLDDDFDGNADFNFDFDKSGGRGTPPYIRWNSRIGCADEESASNLLVVARGGGKHV